MHAMFGVEAEEPGLAGGDVLIEEDDLEVVGLDEIDHPTAVGNQGRFRQAGAEQRRLDTQKKSLVVVNH